MRALSDVELLRQEAAWLRDVARRTRVYARAFPDLGDDERRRIQAAVFHAWIRTRFPLNLQFVTNYAATVITAVGMAAASTVAGLTGAVFAADSNGSAGAPWWLFPLAVWAAVCVGALYAARHDVELVVSLFDRLGRTGTAWRLRNPQLAYWFVPATLLATVVVGAVASWLAVATALTVGPGGRLTAAAAGLFGLLLGAQANQWIASVERVLNRRYRQPHRSRPLDSLLVELMTATSACFHGRSRWWDPRHVAVVRARLAEAVVAAQDHGDTRRRTSITEVASRRQARQFHATLAELVRRHDRAITHARTAREYDTVLASLRSGVLALVDGDLDALLEHGATEPPASKAARLLRRTAPSLTLVAFAVVIPLLPGVDGATGGGVRVLLLMTAALALTPAGDSASGSVRSALERSLFPKGAS
ncbi:hypothetical protein ABT160_33055 [Streptomyces sp. NPDC001941]|uniref:hypothetical protein n=1 Tax=Streptomyces sp. NPDC001941 TaxID=3154659 RepID=UPI00332EFC27